MGRSGRQPGKGAYMEFTFETDYTQKAITAMVKGLRKTLRKKKSARSKIVGWVLVALVVVLTLPAPGEAFTVEGRTILNIAVGIVLVAVLLFEDPINAFVARKRMMSQGRHSSTTFHKDSYTSVTELGKSDFYYGNIRALAETSGYFVLVYDANHGQVYDKSTLSGGTLKEFRAFISQRTNKEITYIK